MKDKVFVYDVDGKAYINLTNRCNNACSFCIRKNEVGIEGYNLWLEHDATYEEVIDQLKSKGRLGEDVVICGYGEPTMNLDVLLEVAKYVRHHGGKVRLNTNGLANAQYGKNIVPLLKEAVDVISISLNDCDKEKYDAVCHSRFGKNAFNYMLLFAKECVKQGIETIMTVVDVIPEENIKKCKKIALDIGAHFRVRTYSDK